MIASACLLLSLLVSSDPPLRPDETPKRTHLFILSGQSNMAGLDPARTFRPTLEKGLAGHDCIVVKDAQGGQPLRRWVRRWSAEGLRDPDPESKNGDLYARLWKKVQAAVEGREVDRVSFFWMQGERDAREGHGAVYAESLRELFAQLRADLKAKGIHDGRLHCVIGRLSDFRSEAYPDWDAVREAQMAVARASVDVDWVDTDDLNGEDDDLHSTREGYDEFGRRLAQAALKWLESPPPLEQDTDGGRR